VLLKRLAPFLLAFVMPLILAYAWWGGFNPVEIRDEVRGPYHYAYLDHEGDYAKLPEIQERALQALRAQRVPYGHAITVLYSNPDVVARADRRARSGYLLAEGTPVAAPLKTDVIPARKVLRARVKASYVLAPSRAYQALDSQLQSAGRGIVMPTVEIYEHARGSLEMGILTVEMALQ